MSEYWLTLGSGDRCDADCALDLNPSSQTRPRPGTWLSRDRAGMSLGQQPSPILLWPPGFLPHAPGSPGGLDGRDEAFGQKASLCWAL